MSARLTRPVLGALGAVALAASASACSMLGGGSVPTADVGDCMNVADLESEVTEFPVIDCSEPHDAEVIHTFAVADSDEFPGEDAISAEAETECSAAFEPYVGTPYESSTVFLRFYSPTAETWELDDREVLCIGFLDDGSTVTESFEGSGL